MVALLSSVMALALSVSSMVAANTIYMRIEGPTHTIYEETLTTTVQKNLTNNGHSAECDGTPYFYGVTILTALDQAGQDFYTSWNGSTFGYIEHINGTTNNATYSWQVLYNNYAYDGIISLVGGVTDPTGAYDSFCYQALDYKQHVLYAFYDATAGDTDFLILSGPATATTGVPVTFNTTAAPPGSWLNDIIYDRTRAGEAVYGALEQATDADGNVYSTTNITFPVAGIYNLKAHCNPDYAATCVRSNHLVVHVDYPSA